MLASRAKMWRLYSSKATSPSSAARSARSRRGATPDRSVAAASVVGKVITSPFAVIRDGRRRGGRSARRTRRHGGLVESHGVRRRLFLLRYFLRSGRFEGRRCAQLL